MLQQNLKLQRYFEVQRLCFRYIGIDLLSKNQSIITNYLLHILPISAQTVTSIAICHFAINNFKNVDEFTKSLEPLWQITIAILKWCTFMYKRHEIVSFVKRILLWNLEANKSELKYIVAENKKDIRFCRLYLVLVASTGYFALINPLIKALVVYFIVGETFYLEPIIKLSFPGDLNKPFNYFLHVILIFGAIHSLVYISVSIDSLFSWITHNIIAKFYILEMRFKMTALENDGHATSKSIAECIKYHCRILRIVQELNMVFSFVMFFKFTISCLQICFLAFQLDRIKNFGDAAFEAGFLIAVSVQLLLYCFNAQRIRDKSLYIADCIYLNFEWEKLSKSSQKLLLLSMARAQKECNLSGIFFNVDLSLFLWVFKTAGSYLALLKTVDEK